MQYIYFFVNENMWYTVAVDGWVESLYGLSQWFIKTCSRPLDVYSNLNTLLESQTKVEGVIDYFIFFAITVHLWFKQYKKTNVTTQWEIKLILDISAYVFMIKSHFQSYFINNSCSSSENLMNYSIDFKEMLHKWPSWIVQFDTPAEMDFLSLFFYLVQFQCCLNSQQQILCLLTKTAFDGLLWG